MRSLSLGLLAAAAATALSAASATGRVAHAGVRFGVPQFDPGSPLLVARDLGPFCDRGAAYWPALSRAQLYLSGQYWFTGGEIRSYVPTVRDLSERELAVETVDGAPLLVQQGYMGAAAYRFNYRIRLAQICDANPGRTFTYGELLDYLGTLRPSATPVAASVGLTDGR